MRANRFVAGRKLRAEIRSTPGSEGGRGKGKGEEENDGENQPPRAGAASTKKIAEREREREENITLPPDFFYAFACDGYRNKVGSVCQVFFQYAIFAEMQKKSRMRAARESVVFCCFA
jgi:hypothetical protein